jgi:hypothetical protein
MYIFVPGIKAAADDVIKDFDKTVDELKNVK